MENKKVIKRIFAISSFLILTAIAFHPAIDPFWNNDTITTIIKGYKKIDNGKNEVLNPIDGYNSCWKIDVLELINATPSDKKIDTDDDGLYDSVELVLGTDVNNSDSDFDGLNDYNESVNHLTDPMKPDTNNDGIADYNEIYQIPEDLDNDNITNAWDPDNDDDGVSDKVDLSPFSKTDLNDHFDFNIKTNGKSTFLDIQIRPSIPEHLTIPLQYWDWPEDDEGLMRDMNNSEEDVFILPYLEMIVETDFKIISKNSGKCLEVSYGNISENATIWQNVYDEKSNQQWSIIPVSEGYVKLIALHSNKCLAVENSSLEENVSIVQEIYIGNDNQLWSMDFLGNNSYVLYAKHSGKCLEIKNSSIDSNATAVQSTFNHKSNQIWIIEDINGYIPEQSDVESYGITIDLNKILTPLTPIWDFGIVPAFNGKLYFPESVPLNISSEIRLIWKVHGKTDTAIGALIACNGKIVSANNSNASIIANKNSIGDWETFELVDLGPDRIALKANNGKYVTLEDKNYDKRFVLEANSSEIGDKETFEIVSENGISVALKAYNENYVTVSNPIGDSSQLSAISNVIGTNEIFTLVDLGYKSNPIPLVSYYEDFLITGFSLQENYGSSIGCFYNQDMNQTLKAGFVFAYEFLRSQNELYEIPVIIENRNITVNSTIHLNLANQDECIYKLMGEMLPQTFYKLTNQTNNTVLPILIAMQDSFATKTMDLLASDVILDGFSFIIDVTDSHIITSKIFKINWYDITNLTILGTEQVLLESMKWGMSLGFDEDNETLATMMALFNAWNGGEYKITKIGDEEIEFNIAESPRVMEIIQYNVFSITSVIDLITVMTKFNKLVSYRFLKFTVKFIKTLLKPLANAIKFGIKVLRLSKVAQKALNALKSVMTAIKSSKAMQSAIKVLKSTKFLSVLDKIGVALVLIDLAITGVIAFYMFWSILFEQGFSDFGAALGAWVVIFSFAYAGIYIALALALPVIGIILAILDMIFDFFGKLLGWFLSLVTKTKVRSQFNLGFVGDPTLETHDYDNNGLDVGDRIEFLARIYGLVSRTNHGNWGDVCDSYINPVLKLSVPEGTKTGSFKTKISTVTDYSWFRNETYDMGIWADPIAMSNFPLTIQLEYSYKRYYDECVWFFGWWCDRESDSGTQKTDITTLYFDIFPGNITSFIYWNELTPLDSDGDGLSDKEELSSASNPWRVDTDGDGLWDRYEADNGLIPYKSDSDNDGLNDKQESLIGTESNNTDSDSDGLTDFEEYRGWQVDLDYFGNMFSLYVSPDPMKNDTDDDGLSDLEEYMLGLNPRSCDSDIDGISDFDEIMFPYQGFISKIDFNGQGNSLRVTPNSTIDTEIILRIIGAKCPITHNSSNCSIVLTIENNSGIMVFNKTIYQEKPSIHSMIENTTSFSFNASGEEGIYIVSYYINWSCFGIVPIYEDRETIGIIDVNVSGSGSKRWECYDLTGGDNDGDAISNLNENIGWEVSFIDSSGLNTVHVTSDPNLIDTDSDGEWDIWEHNCFENSTNPRDPDTDNDGLNDWEEKYRYKTDPLNYDTDGDGLDDQNELIFLSDPFVVDTDSDGLDDKQEFDLNSDPTNKDTDRDGLHDLEEYLFGSSLFLPDTDYDYLFDVMEFNISTDPRDPDTDNDLLLDGEEFFLNTDPKRPDTDNDTLNDYWETYWQTDPLNSDTDNDSLIDGDEIKYAAHPLIKDTDRDGINDFEDYDTYAPNVNEIILAYDLDEDILEFKEHLEMYTNVTVVSLENILNDQNIRNSSYMVLVGSLDAGNDTVGNLSKYILDSTGENTSAIIETGYQFFASKNGFWNETQTIVMLSQPYRLDHLIVLNILKTMIMNVNGSKVSIQWPTPRESFDVEAVDEIDTMLWVELDKPVTPTIEITKYTQQGTPKKLSQDHGLNSKTYPAGLYLSINVSDNVQNDTGDIIDYAWIILYYTASDLDRNGDGDGKDIGDISEKSLKCYVYDEVNDKWIELSKKLDWVIDLGVDTNNLELYGKSYEGYIWAKVSHFSLFGFAGNLIRPKKGDEDGGGVSPISLLADASASEKVGFINVPVNFDASRSYDDNHIIGYYWDFGDGTYGSGKQKTHVYSEIGLYNVVLTVTDSSGLSDTDEFIVVITIPNIPPHTPEINGIMVGVTDTEYIFTAVSTDDDPGDLIRYGWDWDNDYKIDEWSDFLASDTLCSINHSFTKKGFYRIRAQAEDNNSGNSGWSDTLLTFIDINYQQQEDGSYLIDYEKDGDWDYVYDPENDQMSNYLRDTQDENLFSIIILLFVLIVLIIAIILIKQKKANPKDMDKKRPEKGKRKTKK